jgi:hypothetical protein
VLGLTLTQAACGSGKPPSPAAPTSTQPTVTVLTISGLPPSFAVGQSVQLTASGTLSDGTQLDETLKVNWQSSESTVVTVSTTGLLTVMGLGDADVVATLQGVRGSAHVSVLKPVPAAPRYDISGNVHESAPTANVALAGATVGIHFVGCPSCPHDNQTVTTDATGRFTFAAIETAGFSLVVSKSGYETTFFNIAQLPRDQHPDIGVNPALVTIHEILEGVVQRGDSVLRDLAFPVHHGGPIIMEECTTRAFEDYYSFLYRGTPLMRSEPIFSHVCLTGSPSGGSWRYQAEPGFIYTVSVYSEGSFRAVFTHPN